MKNFKILIACEQSQTICIRFRQQGFECYSADIEEPSGNHPEWHILGDVIPIINGNCEFQTMNGVKHKIEGHWDLIIAHPPCTYLASSGNRWFNVERYGEKALQRIQLRKEATQFFMKFVNVECEHVAIENPVGYINSYYRKPDQIIHPYMFGDPERKQTCLWLKGLPLLEKTQVVKPNIVEYKNGKGTDSKWHMETFNLRGKERQKIRSKTFPGIADAIVDQWGKVLEEKGEKGEK